MGLEIQIRSRLELPWNTNTIATSVIINLSSEESI